MGGGCRLQFVLICDGVFHNCFFDVWWGFKIFDTRLPHAFLTLEQLSTFGLAAFLI